MPSCFPWPELEREGIDFVDVGCSGDLNQRWRPLKRILNYTGFDPNTSECQRLSRSHPGYRTARFLPFAIADHEGQRSLHVTNDPSCSSLLRPNQSWLIRFSFHPRFRQLGESVVNCTTLDALWEAEGLRADVLKLDTQGLELPILKTSGRLLRGAFCVELETGFVPNYEEETVFAQVDPFMRDHGFLLFDMEIHRVGRVNSLAKISRKEPLWCESVWLRDLLVPEREGGVTESFDRKRALRALSICRTLGMADYGHELAVLFHSRGLVSDEEERCLSEPRFWVEGHGLHSDRLARLLIWMPGRVRRRLYRSLQAVLETTHPLRRGRVS